MRPSHDGHSMHRFPHCDGARVVRGLLAQPWLLLDLLALTNLAKPFREIGACRHEPVYRSGDCSITLYNRLQSTVSNLTMFILTQTRKKKKKNVSDTEVKQLGHGSKCLPIHLDYPDIVKHPLSSFKYCSSLCEMCSSFLLFHKVHAVSSLDDQVTITPSFYDLLLVCIYHC